MYIFNDINNLSLIVIMIIKKSKKIIKKKTISIHETFLLNLEDNYLYLKVY